MSLPTRVTFDDCRHLLDQLSDTERRFVLERLTEHFKLPAWIARDSEPNSFSAFIKTIIEERDRYARVLRQMAALEWGVRGLTAAQIAKHWEKGSL